MMFSPLSRGVRHWLLIMETHLAVYRMICRVRGRNKSDKLLAVGSSDCVGSGMPPYKYRKLN